MSEVIWFKSDLKVSDLDEVFKGNMLENLDIRLTELGKNYLVCEMPVDERHIQPYGILHGGANCVIAESAASIASNLVSDPKKFNTFGVDINATHLKATKAGDRVQAICRPLHLGRSIHVWDIEVKRMSDMKLVCKSRLTTMNKAKV